MPTSRLCEPGYSLDMRAIYLLGIVLASCGRPSMNELLETPALTYPPVATEPPPASTSDEDRWHLRQEFEDMKSTQDAFREARAAERSRPLPRDAGISTREPDRASRD
jgi:hypothetical protein